MCRSMFIVIKVRWSLVKADRSLGGTGVLESVEYSLLAEVVSSGWCSIVGRTVDAWFKTFFSNET